MLQVEGMWSVTEMGREVIQCAGGEGEVRGHDF